MKNMSYDERCYRLLKRVPRGKVTTYGELARALGSTAYRAVGNAMNRNQEAPKIPCHRVVRSDGSIGGYAFGPSKKAAILKREGVTVRAGKVENFERVFYRFPKR